MNEIKFLLKFGQKEHLESLIKGNIYFSNAITFWGIEDELKIKGQGDKMEASAKIFAQKSKILPTSSNEVITQTHPSILTIKIEPAEKIPVFCLFAVHEEDCILGDNGEFKISLSDYKKRVIREHFPNADGVVVISNPNEFILDIKNSIGFDIKNDCINYFEIDKGHKLDNGKQAIDYEYMNYLMQDTPKTKNGNSVTSYFHEDYAYRVLFCKDIFFKEEQEYRILLPNEKIEIGTNYPVKFSTNYCVVDLSSFFQQ